MPLPTSQACHQLDGGSAKTDTDTCYILDIFVNILSITYKNCFSK